jgi:hypothetical protein
MKKLFAMLVVAGMVGFVACGPSAEEKAEKARQDSMNNVAIEQARIADSTAQAAVEAAHADSIAQGLIK